MRQGARRDALLDDADVLLDEVGLDGLTIATLAERAGVSRQLVYQHFPTVTDLVSAMTMRRFDELRRHFDANRAEVSPRNAALQQLRLVLDLDPRHRQFLREILSPRSRSDESKRIAELVRERLVDRWAEAVDPEHRREAEVRARIWAVFYALWGVWDMLDAGEITPEQGWTIMESFLKFSPS